MKKGMGTKIVAIIAIVTLFIGVVGTSAMIIIELVNQDKKNDIEFTPEQLQEMLGEQNNDTGIKISGENENLDKEVLKDSIEELQNQINNGELDTENTDTNNETPNE